MKIRSKINISFLAIFILILSLVGLAVGLYTTNLVKNYIYSYLTSSNRARAEHIRTYLQDQKFLGVILAASSVYRDFLKEPITSNQYPVIKEKVTRRLTRTSEADPHIYEAMILDASGKIVASSNPAEEGADKSTDAYFTEARNGVFIKSIYFSETIKKLTYAVSAPIISDEGVLLGVSVLRYLPDNFYSVVNSENGLGSTEENFLINQNKFFITPSRFLGEEAILKQKVETKNANDCFEPKEVDYVKKNGYNGLADFIGGFNIVEAVDYRKVNVVATHAYIPETGWCLITKVNKTDFLSFRWPLIITLTSIFFIAELLFLLISIFLSKNITKPIGILSAGVERIKQGNFNFKTDIKSKDEVGELAKAFDLMVGAVKKSRAETEKKINEQTKELGLKADELENQKKAILNILEDVDAEKKEVQVLADELEKFKMAVDHSFDHIVITDLDGIVLYANSSVERITGYALEETVGAKAGKLWGGLMNMKIYKELWKTIKTDKNVFTGEFVNHRKDGEKYQAEATITPILDGKGKILYFLGVERDISERKEAEEQIRLVLNDLQEKSQILSEEKAKDDTLLAEIGDGIVVTNQDGIITFVNSSGFNMLGYDPKELVGKPIIESLKLVDEKDKEMDVAQRPMILALATGEKTVLPRGQVHYYLRKDKTKFPVNLTVTPYVWQNKIVGTIMVFRDITIEAEIDRMKTEFVSLASHQLRTPLATINWYTEMLKSGDGGKVNKSQMEYLNEIYKGSQRMVELVNALLNVSRIELGTFAVEPEMADLKDIAESVFDELKSIIANKKMKIKKDYDKSAKKIFIDAKLIRIAFQNLLTNALKYTPAKGTISLAIKKRAKDYLISVADTGVGIPKKDQDKIFSKMFRADNVKIIDTGGTGLGLYIIRSIIEQSSSGKIWFESVENKGTTFYFTLPLTGMKKKDGSKALV